MSFKEPIGEEINPFTQEPYRRENLQARIDRLRPDFINLGYNLEPSYERATATPSTPGSTSSPFTRINIKFQQSHLPKNEAFEEDDEVFLPDTKEVIMKMDESKAPIERHENEENMEIASPSSSSVTDLKIENLDIRKDSTIHMPSVRKFSVPSSVSSANIQKREFRNHSFLFMDDHSMDSMDSERIKYENSMLGCFDEIFKTEKESNAVLAELESITKQIWPKPRDVSASDDVTMLNVNEYDFDQVLEMIHDTALNNPEFLAFFESVCERSSPNDDESI